jgi:hypothetical protein
VYSMSYAQVQPAVPAVGALVEVTVLHVLSLDRAGH